ncbi:MAG: glutathione peroxidase [Phycisphaeraceae bacterium]
MRVTLPVLLMCSMLLAGGCDPQSPEAGESEPTTMHEATNAANDAANDAVNEAGTTANAAHVLAGLTMNGLDGQPVDLASHAGKVVLLVNVASKCGHTPQYEGLQNLHERYTDEGLVVVGVPSNDFGGQEPGSAEEIAEFCQANYGVTFAMLEKVQVTGDDKVTLYQRLTDAQNDPTDGGEVKWNFEKFVVDRDGNVAHRFRSGVQPESDEMIAAIEQALAGS